MARSGRRKPVRVWELQYRMPDMATYDEERHAEDVVKLVSTALASGVSSLVYHTYSATERRQELMDAVPLTTFYDRTFHVRKAYHAFRTLSELVAGFTRVEPMQAGPGVLATRYETPGRKVYVLWGQDGTRVSLPLRPTARWLGLYGEDRGGVPPAVPLGSRPTFVVD